MFRSLILFGHVVGVLVLFVGLGLEWLTLEAVRRATARGEAVSWLRASAPVPRLSALALVVILASGVFLGARIGVLGNAWMRASYAALVLMAIAGGAVAGPRMRQLRRAADDPNDRGLAALHAAASNPLLLASVRVRIAFGLAVVYLMIGKPEMLESLLVMGAAALLAIVASLPKRSTRSTLIEGFQ